MSPIALIDIGSARTKLTIGHISDTNAFVLDHASKIESGFLGKIGSDGALDVEHIDALVRSLHAILEIVHENGASSVLVLATESLRKTTDGDAIVSRVQNELGLAINLLSPTSEASILFNGMRTDDGRTLPVCDIGGGSVQLAWSEDGSLSIPTGTFALEKQFQASGVLPTDETYERMRAQIRHALEKALNGRNVKTDTLIVGTSAMRDFFDSALVIANIVAEPQETYAASDIDALFAQVAGKPYAELGRLFPKNPNFLFGADKLLINVQELLRATGATAIVPTNESLSTSLIRLAARPDALAQIGLRVSSIG